MKSHNIFCASLFILSSCGTENLEKPNIVLILADDLGYSDLGCYGGEIMTPTLDSLAASGLRYSQFYNAARSCPSRASLLTGLYPHQAGIGHMTDDLGYDSYKGSLSNNCMTIAEVLDNAGYQTAMVGKWHVSSNISANGDTAQWPLQRGFDKFYGTLGGHCSFWDPKALYEGNNPIKASGDYYYTEAISDKAVQYIQEMSEDESPFFLYVAYTAPHYPIQARSEFIDKYMSTYSVGWDSLRFARFNKMKELGIISSDTILPEKDEQCYDWSTEQYKECQQLRMSVYAAMVEQMDCGIQKIMNVLRQKGMLDNTLIVFLSDNGASNEGHLYNTVERTGARWKDSMIPDTTRDGRKVKPGDFPGVSVGADDTYGSYGSQWAHLSNTPFRRYKSWAHEGGISCPLIIAWGDNIKDKGKIHRGTYCIMDLMPTFIEISGSKYPERYHDMDIIPLEGTSMLQSITDNNYLEKSRTLFWEHEGNRAVRSGKWKLVSEYPGSWSKIRTYSKNGQWELYDMSVDRTETTDLSQMYPEVVDSLMSEWENWADRISVRPWSELEE